MQDRLVNLSYYKSERKALVLTIVYFLFSLLEIYAEFFKNSLIQWLTKPFLIPVLIVLYSITSKKVSKLYCTALLLNWIANLLFVSSDFKLMFLASICFLFYRTLIVVKIFKMEKLNLFPIVLGSIPFLFLFLSVISMIYENIDGGQYALILFQVVLMTFFGGFSLGNYVIKNTVSSKVLLISSLFFGINLFVLGIKFYYIDLNFLKPISMIFFVLGHYTFYHFMILNEKK